MTQAVEVLIHRVDDTLAQASGRFPMYADPATGEWSWSEDGGWFGGFWPALLWLSAMSTGDAKYNHAAIDAACRLRPRTDAPTVLRGLLHWYGAGLGSTLGLANDDTAAIAIAASRSMSADFDPVGQLLPPGEEDASEYHWPRPGACIDGLPGTVPLLAFAAERTHDPMLRSMALSHARALLAFCVRSDGSVAQSATYDTSGDLISRAAISGYSKTSTWARAQTWAMLGLAQAAHLSAEFVHPALQVADWYLNHVPEDHVCHWDFDDPAIPNAPRDTSAAAIASAALIRLASFGGNRYRRAAETTLHALSTKHLTTRGALIDGAYNKINGVAISNELIWGDYFMLEASLALEGTIDPTLL